MSTNSKLQTPNSELSSAAPAERAPTLLDYAPAVRVALLVKVVRDKFPIVRQSMTLAFDWALAQIGLQRKWSAEARAIDDELEAATARLREHWETFEQAFSNDAPATRRQCLADLRLLLKASDTTHANTETLSAQLTLDIPHPLLPEAVR